MKKYFNLQLFDNGGEGGSGLREGGEEDGEDDGGGKGAGDECENELGHDAVFQAG